MEFGKIDIGGAVVADFSRIAIGRGNRGAGK